MLRKVHVTGVNDHFIPVFGPQTQGPGFIQIGQDAAQDLVILVHFNAFTQSPGSFQPSEAQCLETVFGPALIQKVKVPHQAGYDLFNINRSR